MVLQPKSFVEPQTFLCRAYGRRLSVLDCMTKYVDANALNWKHTPCFKCAQGTENRAGYSKG